MNELTTVRPASNVEAYRASTDAAELCRQIVVETSSMIQKRRYVSVEGWQAIARAHGCAAGARDVERVEGGVRAVGEVRDILTGQIIATAEGFVGEDEPVWYGGGKDKWGKPYVKRAEYAIRAMAQTRAMSRACRSAFAHVVVMMNAGLQTTPAEEVPAEGFDNARSPSPHNPQTGEVIEGEAVERERVPGITKIKNNLNKFMREGNKATELEAFRAMVKANKDDIKTIREANHSYWTGDGEDFEGFEKWMERRYAELSRVDSAEFQFLASVIQECPTTSDLSSILDEYQGKIDELDGEESRRFEEIYNARETALKSPTPMVAGAFGG